ncbi:MAG: sigma-B regulation protein RsbU (phosphoserine phosphatase) [Arenicella sp.]
MAQLQTQQGREQSRTTAGLASRLDVRKLTLLFALLSWLGLVLLGLVEQSIWENEALKLENPIPLKGLLLNAFIFNIYIYSWQQTQKQDGIDFYSLFWRVFITIVLCTLVSVGITGLIIHLEEGQFAKKTQELVHCLGFHVEFGLLLFFLMMAFSKWKKIILYEKTTLVWWAWIAFEVILFSATITHFFAISELNNYFYLAYGIITLLAFLLSVNLKWIPYLNFKQKLWSIPMMLTILACLGYFGNSFHGYFSHEPLVVDDISKSIFIAVIFSFVALYTFVSLMSVIFNLPSSSVFDRKFREISEFQQTNEDLLGKSEQEVYEVLLNSLIDLVRADAAWLETSQDKVFIAKNMSREDALKFKKAIAEKGYDGSSYKNFSNSLFSSQNSVSSTYNSILAVPLKSGNQQAGNLVLLKKMRNAFDNMMVAIVNTFTAQANVAIHNHKLMQGIGVSNIDQSGMMIAKGVQERLFPKNLEKIKDLEIFASTESAEAVGGDYYDIHEVSSGKYAVFISDVAGKGIVAAFTMAQMKGIFKSLVQTAFTPHEFMKHANMALSGVLEKNVFITASYFLIDTNESKIYFSRAGHCPTLYYDDKKKEVEYFNNQGLGLGIITNEKFERFIEVTDFYYNPNDLLVLYTDGIVEAKNEETGEEYGYERLQQFISDNKETPLADISSKLLKDVRETIQSEKLQDDYTLILVRMK